MKHEEYEAFLRCKESGIKDGAKHHLDAFIQSFSNDHEKQSWVQTFLGSGEYGHRIRHELYTYVVFPVLLEGFKKSDPWALLWLAKTAQNLYSARSLHQEVGLLSEFQLAKQCYELDRENDEAKSLVLENLINIFRYAMHEWPAGILDGANGASVESCKEYLSDVEFARTLDGPKKYGWLLDDFEKKVSLYLERLTT